MNIILIILLILPILSLSYPYIPKLKSANFQLYNHEVTYSPLLLTTPYYCTSYTNQSYSCNCISCNCDTCYNCGCKSSIYQCESGYCDSGECVCFFCHCCRTEKCDYPCKCKSCCDTCSRIVCENQQSYSILSISPSTGSILDKSSIKCRFMTPNSHINVNGILTDSEHINCLSPAHTISKTVNLEISVDGLMWTENLFQFTYNACPFTSEGTCNNKGVCTENELCLCDAGMTGLYCNATCPGPSDFPCNGRGINSRSCNSDGTCTCISGWYGNTCESICPGSNNGEVCSNNGVCAITGVCTCFPGFVGSNCSIAGNCDQNGNCSCPIGKYGDNCELNCPGNGINSTCSNNGHCTLLGQCLCNSGYYGISCDLSCLPASSPCNSRGFCNKGTCECDYGYFGSICENRCPGVDICSNNGQCSNGLCTCNTRYTGLDCSLSCPLFNNMTCSNVGVCSLTSLNTAACVCNNGYYGLNCQFRCPGASLPCSGHGMCQSGVCFCNNGFWGDTCTNECPGGFTNSCYGGGICNQNSGACSCLPGRWGVDCKQKCPGGENTPCSLNGLCDSVNGACTCNPGYSGSNCSIPVCLNNCNNHGVCVNGACVCDNYQVWTGKYCSEPANSPASGNNETLALIYGLVQFGKSSYEVSNDISTLNIPIYRYTSPNDQSNSNCLLNGTIRAQLNTSDLTALNGLDYVLAHTDFIWGPNDCSTLLVSIIIINNQYQEDFEKFIVFIERIDGGAQFGNTSTVTVLIDAHDVKDSNSDILTISCHLTIPFSSIPEGSKQRNTFYDGFRSELCNFLSLSIDKMSLIYLKDGELDNIPGTFISFSIYIPAGNSPSSTTVANKFMYLFRDFESRLYNGTFTKYVDGTNIPSLSQDSSNPNVSNPNNSLLVGLSVGIPILIILSICGVLYYYRKSVSEWLLWKIGEFRFRSLKNEEDGSSYSLPTIYPPIESITEEYDDNFDLYDNPKENADYSKVAKYSFGELHEEILEHNIKLDHMSKIEQL